MNHRHLDRYTAAIIGLGLILSTSLSAEELVYETHVLPDTLLIEPMDRAALESSVDLIVKGPEEFFSRTRFRAGEPIEIGLRGLADGRYNYELQVMGIRGRRASRELDSGFAPAIPQGASGVFTIVDGYAADRELTETPDSSSGSASVHGNSLTRDKADIPSDATPRDQVIVDDQIVIGSLCIGQDCVNGENFGFDTIRLKENNLRIKFDDTSNSASFPNVDWQLTANESANGGANKFSIEDITNARIPFTVEANAPNNALYIDDTGRLGLGTSVPAVEQHIVNGDSPALRLDQNGSSGFTPQAWDVAGNETNFFVRDVTNGSKLPFKIRPNSPTDSVVVEPAGTRFNNLTTFSANVGMGVTTADHRLQVRGDTTDAPVKVEVVDDSNLIREMLLISNNGGSTIQFDDTSSDLHDWQVSATRFGFFITEEDSGVTEFVLQRGTGNLSISGTLSENSDVNRKSNITPVDPADVLQRVVELPISTWAYQEDEQVMHLGPMAQDFFRQFGLGSNERSIATIDTSGVALAAIQGLKQMLDEKDQEIDELRAEIDRLKELASAQNVLVNRIEELSERLNTVERVQDDAVLSRATELVHAEH